MRKLGFVREGNPDWEILTEMTVVLELLPINMRNHHKTRDTQNRQHTLIGAGLSNLPSILVQIGPK